MTYETRQRPEIFCSLSPENQALIMVTHLTRWRDGNASRLSAAQLAAINDWLDLVLRRFIGARARRRSCGDMKSWKRGVLSFSRKTT